MRYDLGCICEYAYDWYHTKNTGSELSQYGSVIFELDSEDPTVAYLTITNTEDPDVDCFYKFRNGFLIEIIDPLYPEPDCD